MPPSCAFMLSKCFASLKFSEAQNFTLVQFEDSIWFKNSITFFVSSDSNEFFAKHDRNFTKARLSACLAANCASFARLLTFELDIYSTMGCEATCLFAC